MTEPTYEAKETLVMEILTYYRQHSATCRGPMQAVDACWARVQARIAADLAATLMKQALAHEVSRHAANGQSYAEGWKAATGMLRMTLDQGRAAGETVQIPVTRPASKGATRIVYPRILVHTVYATATGSKPLVYFTVDDLRYQMTAFADQRRGLDARLEAMRYGVTLLTTHQVTRIADLPDAQVQAFAERWSDVVHPTKAAPAA